MNDDFGHLFPRAGQWRCWAPTNASARFRADRWIRYPRAQHALAKLEELIAFPQRARMPNLLIVGASGMGKTMIVEKFARDHPAHFDATKGVEHMPVIVVQMVSGPDEARFTSGFWPRSGAGAASGDTRPVGKPGAAPLERNPAQGSTSSMRSTACRRARCENKRDS